MNPAMQRQRDLRWRQRLTGPMRLHRPQPPVPPDGARAGEFFYKIGPATQANPALLNTGPPTSTQLAGLQSLMITSHADPARETPTPKPKRPWDYLKPGIRPLLLILLAQAVLSVHLLWANTAYQDEALYIWAGHLELGYWLHGTPAPDFATYFSGAPVIYPPLAAMADSLGGLAAARGLSLIFMMGSTILLYLTARRLFTRRVAIMSAAFFATLGWADQLGAFATYDAMAIFLIALSSWLVVRARGWLSEPMIALAAIFLALADAAKYASTLWDPILIGLIVLAPSEIGWPRKIFRGIRMASYTVIVILVALRAAGHSYIQGINFTTLQRQIVTGTGPLQIIDIAWGWLALIVLLAFLGIFLSWYDHGRPYALPVLLFIAGLLAPFAQARDNDITSLHKHVVFGAWFLCMMTGYAASKLTHLDNKLSHGALISVVVIAAGAITGYLEVNTYIGEWPNVSKTMPALSTAITKAHCPCLIFEEDDAHYYLPGNLLGNGLVGPYTFSFHSPHTWKTVQGPQAMADAIDNGYFGAVEIDASQTGADYRLITQSLQASDQYTLVSSVPWPEHPGEPTQVWRLKIGTGGE